VADSMNDSTLVVQADGTVKAVFHGDVEATSFTLSENDSSKNKGQPPESVRWVDSGGTTNETVWSAQRAFELHPKVKTTFHSLLGEAGEELRAIVNHLGGSSFLQLGDLHIPENQGHFQAPQMQFAVGETRVIFEAFESEGETETVEHLLGRKPQFVGIFAEIATGYVIAFDYHITERDEWFFQFEPIASTPVPGAINVPAMWVAIG
jgi:hypothetical protein